MTDSPDPMSLALQRIAREAAQQTGTLDLTDLDLSELPEAVFDLRHLQVLRVRDWESGDYSDVLLLNHVRDKFKTLSELRDLSLDVSDLNNLDFVAHLPNLQSLNCSGTQVTDLTPLANLKDLQSLNCSDTHVADITPLANINALQSLECSYTRVADITPLANLKDLQSLNCSRTHVADLAPLANLKDLQSLDCSSRHVADLTPLANLKDLQSLQCSGTQVADLTPLVGLKDLQSLNCSRTHVADLAPLANLKDLQSLDCSFTQVADLAPLANLKDLQSLDCWGTQVADLTPLAGLNTLESLNCEDCALIALPSEIWAKPSLHNLYLYQTRIPGIPNGILSQDFWENCLDTVRAYFEDLAKAPAVLEDIRLLVLGNGRVGKTQIGRRLTGQAFQPDSVSTHGIVIGDLDLPGDPPAHLKLWDFGGQDIYHGVHALFLRGPVVLMLVWDAKTEQERFNRHGGLEFQNYPLPYWVDVAQNLADPSSPVVIVQNKCDQPGQEARRLPVADDAREALAYVQSLSFSAETGYNEATLKAYLQNAITWLRAPERGLGLPTIGAGWMRVIRQLESLREADQALPAEMRQHRLLRVDAFEAICAEAGVSQPKHLLTYLDATATVFYRPGLFNDIVLDKDWALSAIYTVFERQEVYPQILMGGGRFNRAVLATHVWREHSVEEQKLLLSLMRSCGICFLHRGYGGDDDNAEYIAPNLLPERAAVAERIDARWSDELAEITEVFAYPFMMEGSLIRAIMAEIGEQAGADALYWRSGLLGFEAKTRSRFRIEENMTGDWKGEIILRTQGGQAEALSQALVTSIERAQQQLRLQPENREPSKPAAQEQNPPEMRFTQEKPAMPEWYVSYAWGDDKTPDGRARDAAVEGLCQIAAAAGLKVIRDKDELSVGDSIVNFMRRIGASDRVFVLLSEKYLQSANCMFELSEIWRTSKGEGPDFRKRIRVYALDETKIWRAADWARHAAFWKKEHDELQALAAENGAGILGEKGHKQLMLMQRFYTQVSDILGTLAEYVQPRTLEDLVKSGLDGGPET